MPVVAVESLEEALLGYILLWLQEKIEIIIINLKEILLSAINCVFFLIAQCQNVGDDVQSAEVTTGRSFTSWFTGFKGTVYKH